MLGPPPWVSKSLRPAQERRLLIMEALSKLKRIQATWVDWFKHEICHHIRGEPHLQWRQTPSRACDWPCGGGCHACSGAA